ncbi:hypothetical protein [Yunchengibacter salinarum]|uniref:hypothetical protein n=1 Tax=Yunchengibacter salinarum TaxID=3133399 RepID=UPI0035B6A094
MTTIDCVQLASATVFPLVVVAVIINRLSSGKGIGVRVVQFTAAAMVIPGVVILATGGFIGGETSAALIGAFIGYLFANIGNFEKSG